MCVYTTKCKLKIHTNITNSINCRTRASGMCNSHLSTQVTTEFHELNVLQCVAVCLLCVIVCCSVSLHIDLST